MTNDLNFPTSSKDLNEDGSGGSFAVKIMDIFEDFNPGYAGGKNGLYVEIETMKNHKTRQVFYPTPEGTGKERKVSARTKKLLEQLDKLDISPDKLGGWKSLCGYVVAWKQEQNSFTDKDGNVVNYNTEFPIKVLEAPSSNGNGGSAGESAVQSPFDRFKAIAIGKTKTELRFAIANDPELASQYGQQLQGDEFLSELISNGTLVLAGSKFSQGNNF